MVTNNNLLGIVRMKVLKEKDDRVDDEGDIDDVDELVGKLILLIADR